MWKNGGLSAVRCTCSLRPQLKQGRLSPFRSPCTLTTLLSQTMLWRTWLWCHWWATTIFRCIFFFCKVFPVLLFSSVHCRMPTHLHPPAPLHGSSLTALQFAPSLAGRCPWLCRITVALASLPFRYWTAKVPWLYFTPYRPQRTAQKKSSRASSSNPKTKRAAEVSISTLITATEPG